VNAGDPSGWRDFLDSVLWDSDLSEDQNRDRTTLGARLLRSTPKLFSIAAALASVIGIMWAFSYYAFVARVFPLGDAKAVATLLYVVAVTGVAMVAFLTLTICIPGLAMRYRLGSKPATATSASDGDILVPSAIVFVALALGSAGLVLALDAIQALSLQYLLVMAFMALPFVVLLPTITTDSGWQFLSKRWPTVLFSTMTWLLGTFIVAGLFATADIKSGDVPGGFLALLVGYGLCAMLDIAIVVHGISHARFVLMAIFAVVLILRAEVILPMPFRVARIGGFVALVDFRDPEAEAVVTAQCRLDRVKNEGLYSMYIVDRSGDQVWFRCRPHSQPADDKEHFRLRAIDRAQIDLTLK
jgi:hypothetical protein